MVLLEMPTDRVRPGIQALAAEAPAEFDGQGDRRLGDRRR
jgi:hypothetical protein